MPLFFLLPFFPVFHWTPDVFQHALNCSHSYSFSPKYTLTEAHLVNRTLHAFWPLFSSYLFVVSSWLRSVCFLGSLQMLMCMCSKPLVPSCWWTDGTKGRTCNVYLCSMREMQAPICTAPGGVERNEGGVEVGWGGVDEKKARLGEMRRWGHGGRMSRGIEGRVGESERLRG